MTILEDLDSVIVAAEADAARELVRTQSEKTRGWQLELEKFNSELQAIQAKRLALVESGEQTMKWPKTDGAVTALTAFGKCIEDKSAGDAEFYKKAAKALGILQDKTQSSVDNCIESVLEKLKEQKKQARGYETLGEVPGLEQTSALLHEFEALAKENWVRANAAQLGVLLQRRNDAVRRLDELATAGADIPDAVRKFFREARAGGATVAQFELKEVRAFLENRKQLDAVRVIIK